MHYLLELRNVVVQDKHSLDEPPLQVVQELSQVLHVKSLGSIYRFGAVQDKQCFPSRPFLQF